MPESRLRNMSAEAIDEDTDLWSVDLGEIASGAKVQPSKEDAPSSKRNNKRRTLGSSWWWWELAAALLCTACIFLIVAALLNIDGQPLSRWSLAISPNAVISVLTTVAKSALLFLVAECISQLKWQHFNQAHTLSDLQAFDEASRGPWGSFAFLWRTRGTALIATIGCVITVASLGFEPTAQQILDFPLRTTVAADEVAQIGIASHFHLNFNDSGLSLSPIPGRAPGPTTPPLPIQLAILTGLVGQTNEVEHSCSTSQCHFGDVISLGICASCEDLTPALTHDCIYNTIEYQMAGGRWDADAWSCRFRYSNVHTQRPTLLGYMTFYDWNFAIEQAPIVNVRARVGGQWNPFKDKFGGFATLKRRKAQDGMYFHSNVNQSSDALVEATTCAWDWCERSYTNLSIVDGVMRYDIEATRPLVPVYPRLLSGGFSRKGKDNATVETYELKSIDSSGPKRSYQIDWMSELSIFAYLTTILHKNLTEGGIHDDQPQPDPILQIVDGQNATKVAHDIALALSHAMRNPVSMNATILSGSAIREDTFVHVRWYWLVLSINLTVLGIVLLVLTIVGNRGTETPLLKSSALATMFHPLEKLTPDEMEIREPENAAALSRIARGMKVQLRVDGKGVLKFEKID